MWPLYCEIKVIPLVILIQIEYGKTMFKFERKMLPSAFDHYFKKPIMCFDDRSKAKKKPPALPSLAVY